MVKLKKRGNLCKIINSKGKKIVKCYSQRGKIIGVFTPKKKRR